MNTGQTMLTIGALALLSVITMRYYSTMGQAGRTIANTSAGFTATTVAASFLERTENAQFDACDDTIHYAFTDSSRFTKPSMLGREAGDTAGHYETYDDIDDFNGDTITYTPGWMGEQYKVYFKVYYVSPWGGDKLYIPSTSTKGQTFLKRIDVKVWRSYPPVDPTESRGDTVKVSALHGYYFFNP